MERILAQSEVDVFRAVEIVKQNRPQLLNFTICLIFFQNSKFRFFPLSPQILLNGALNWLCILGDLDSSRHHAEKLGKVPQSRSCYLFLNQNKMCDYILSLLLKGFS
ncbi:unnamed protein product [Rodentolepis nana]|uniref:Uncharacterized protein n=1 Tax=Rodentolepis nana TaxID=102285 RepID=A0A0R3TBA2_RODNA|nr:unnamed protein product [Rodentolepis nana]